MAAEMTSGAYRVGTTTAVASAPLVQGRASRSRLPRERQPLGRDPWDLPGRVAAYDLQRGTSGISRPFPSHLAGKPGATLGYCVRECVNRGRRRRPWLGPRRCALLIGLGWLGFALLF